MIILGIDPGYAITGYGIIEYENNKYRVIDYGSVQTKAGIPLPVRLCKIYDDLTEIMEKYKPNAFAIEELFFNNNAKTALAVGHGRGVALLAANKANIEIYEYTPLQVKQSLTGYGRADKLQIQRMVQILLKLKEIPKPDDVADALAIAVCHANSSTILKIKEKI